jgi:transposase InsO family protein
VLTFLDDFTHWCWTVTLKDKTSQSVQKAFHDLIKLIQNETELKIKYLRTDNGGEYEGYLTPMLEHMGIKHETTVPFSSPSNGKAERLNRTLNEHVRAMLFQANMPQSFWAEAMATAAYLINRLPSSSIDGIPYELWYEKVLDSKELKLLKPFGCLVNVHNPEQRLKPLNKFDSRSTFGCFIGYHTSVSYKI